MKRNGYQSSSNNENGDIPFLVCGILRLFLMICAIKMRAAQVTTAHKVRATVKITKSSSVGVLLEIIDSDTADTSLVGAILLKVGVGGATKHIMEINHTIISF